MNFSLTTYNVKTTKATTVGAVETVETEGKDGEITTNEYTTTSVSVEANFILIGVSLNIDFLEIK